MKKIVLAVDGKKVPKEAFEFIKSYHEKEPFLLVGTFFHPVDIRILVNEDVTPNSELYYGAEDDEYEQLDAVIKEFKQLCEKQHIEYRIHLQSNKTALNKLAKESRFADLLIINEHLFFRHDQREHHQFFLEEALRRSECPVLLIPEDCGAVKKVAIAYDGKKECMFAMKEFCDLFPAYTNLPVDIFYWVNKTDDEIPDVEYLEEFIGRHFTNANLREAFFDPSKYLTEWVKENKNTLFVTGSFSRSSLSNFLKKSFIDDLIKQHTGLVFVAHS